MANPEPHPIARLLIERGGAVLTESIALPNGKNVEIAKACSRWSRWHGSRQSLQWLPRTLAVKPLVNVGGNPVFAEIAIVRILEASGWRALWVDSYHRKYRRDVHPETDNIRGDAQAVRGTVIMRTLPAGSGAFHALLGSARLTYDNARGHLRTWRNSLDAESFFQASAAQCCRPSEDAMSQNQNPNPNQKPGQGGQQSDQDKKNPQHQQDQQRDKEPSQVGQGGQSDKDQQGQQDKNKQGQR